MIVVNLFGVPSAGKSSGAAYIFSKLKMAGINAELVTEFAKDKVWEESKEVFNCQEYLFGKQSFRLSRLKNKVDVVITDSPLPLNILYNNNDILGETFNDLVMKVFNSYTNINILLNRVKPYNPIGRHQTEEESNALTAPLINILNKYHINYTKYNGCIQDYDCIIDTVFNIIKKEE